MDKEGLPHYPQQHYLKNQMQAAVMGPQLISPQVGVLQQSTTDIPQTGKIEVRAESMNGKFFLVGSANICRLEIFTLESKQVLLLFTGVMKIAVISNILLIFFSVPTITKDA